MHCLDTLFTLNLILIRRLKTLDWKMFINIYKQDCGGWRLCLLCLGKNNTPLLINKGPSSQSYGFSNSRVWLWELDYKESWAQKNWHFWTVVLEKTLESPLDCKEIKPVNPKGNQSWIFIRSIGAKAETPILWPPDAKNWLIGKDPDAGKNWRREEKETTEDEMVGWHHQRDGHEFE